MVSLNKFYNNLSKDEKISLIGFTSLILLFASLTLQLSFNFYGSLNGNFISSLIFSNNFIINDIFLFPI